MRPENSAALPEVRIAVLESDGSISIVKNDRGERADPA